MSWTECEHLPDVKAERGNSQANPDTPVGPRRKKRKEVKPYLIEMRALHPTKHFFRWMDGNWHLCGRFARKEDRDREIRKAERKRGHYMEFRAREEST